jgi:hypothetical protein
MAYFPLLQISVDYSGKKENFYSWFVCLIQALFLGEISHSNHPFFSKKSRAVFKKKIYKKMCSRHIMTEKELDVAIFR